MLFIPQIALACGMKLHVSLHSNIVFFLNAYAEKNKMHGPKFWRRGEEYRIEPSPEMPASVRGSIGTSFLRS